MQTTDFIVDLGDLGEQTLHVDYLFSFGRPAQISGPVERCYEAEPDELEVLAIKLEGGEVATGKLADLLRDFLQEGKPFYDHVLEVETERSNGSF